MRVLLNGAGTATGRTCSKARNGGRGAASWVDAGDVRVPAARETGRSGRAPPRWFELGELRRVEQGVAASRPEGRATCPGGGGRGRRRPQRSRCPRRPRPRRRPARARRVPGCPSHRWRRRSSQAPRPGASAICTTWVSGGVGAGQHGVRHEAADDDGSDDRRQTDPPPRGHATRLRVADKHAIRNSGDAGQAPRPGSGGRRRLGACTVRSGSGPAGLAPRRTTSAGRLCRPGPARRRSPPAYATARTRPRSRPRTLPPLPTDHRDLRHQSSVRGRNGRNQGQRAPSRRRSHAVPEVTGSELEPRRRPGPGLARVRPRPPSGPRPPPVAAARDTRPARSQ